MPIPAPITPGPRAASSAPGKRLSRAEGVSQATIREALGQLERFGLVVRTPNIGTEVTRLSQEEVLERVELRMLLEERALTQAAPRMDGPAFDTLASMESAQALYRQLGFLEIAPYNTTHIPGTRFYSRVLVDA
jgi:DNA-binding GntR family transcriptional regulator